MLINYRAAKEHFPLDVSFPDSHSNISLIISLIAASSPFKTYHPL